MTSIRPFLWFDDRAGEALDFYEKVFRGSDAVSVEHADQDEASTAPGFMGSLRLLNLEVMLFNGGPGHEFNDAISLFLSCEDQATVDYYWDALVDGGQPVACGWLRDRFGVAWQVVPELLMDLMSQPDAERASRVVAAMMTMVKLDCAALQAASDGPSAQM